MNVIDRIDRWTDAPKSDVKVNIRVWTVLVLFVVLGGLGILGLGTGIVWMLDHASFLLAAIPITILTGVGIYGALPDRKPKELRKGAK